MIKKFCLTLLTSALMVFAVSGNAAEEIEKIVGTYQGEVFNNIGLDAVTTIFKFEASGRLSGNYVVDEAEGVFRGTISNIQFETPHKISFQWTDKFGEGFAVAEFSKDYESFIGEWSDKNGAANQPWTGKKEH